jgi:methylmalonyl-CoA mutase N-terminal domain/subunit
MGGAQSLHTNSRDEALSLPTEEAARLALQTQQVIAWESGAADIADSLGGAYALESLTNTIEEKSQEYLDRIEAMGGMLFAISSGFVQREIQQAAYEHQKAIESGERVIVGVNRFGSDRAIPIPLHHLDPAIETSQVSALQQMKSTRENDAVKQTLQALETTAAGSENLIPPILRAVEAYATVGEISDRLRQVFGEHKEG